MSEIAITTLQGTGYFQNSIKKTLEQGRVAQETKEAIFQGKLEGERKRIQSVYNSRGKLVEDYSQSERHLDIFA